MSNLDRGCSQSLACHGLMLQGFQSGGKSQKLMFVFVYKNLSIFHALLIKSKCLKTCTWITVTELWPEICFPGWRHRTGLTWGKETEAVREGRRSGSQKHLTPRNWVLEKQGQAPPTLSSPSKVVIESLPRLSACVWAPKYWGPERLNDF